MSGLTYYLEYLGLYQVFIPLFLLLFFVLFFISIYCKVNGPKSALATLTFYVPMLGSAILGILLFYTSHFWITLFIYVIVFFLLNFVSFSALEKAIEDKTGLGATMFSGMISLFAFFFLAVLRFILLQFS